MQQTISDKSPVASNQLSVLLSVSYIWDEKQLQCADLLLVI